MEKTNTAYETALKKFNDEQTEKQMLLSLLNEENSAIDESRNVRQRSDGQSIMIDLCIEDWLTI